jgi:predicted dehydrogenase
MAIRIGLVGLGDAATHHARALAQLEREGACRWAVVCARDPERIEAFREAHEVPAHVRSIAGFEALLDEGSCDAVILATPDPVHTEQLVRCTARGVHVLVEKPLATSLEAGRVALKLARDRGVVVRVGYHLRHHPAHRLVHARAKQLIGPLRNIQLHWAWRDPNTDGWRAAGEGRFWALAALGTHCIDLARWFVGAEPTRLTCLREPPQGVDRSAELSLAFGRALAHASVSVTHRARSRLVLVGDEGEIECVGTVGSRGDGRVWVHAHDKPREALSYTPRDPHLAQLEVFLDAVRRKDFQPPGDALANLAVLDAIAAGETNLT